MTNIIVCNQCGHVLLSGSGTIYFPPGSSIGCLKCGNKHVFGKELSQKDSEDDYTPPEPTRSYDVKLKLKKVNDEKPL